MATSKARITIRHLSGSKVNQIEQFDLDGLQEITIGREPSSRIAFDLQRDDEVSRKHAVIRIKNGAELYFRIADLNSSNGTFLNGEHCRRGRAASRGRRGTRFGRAKIHFRRPAPAGKPAGPHAPDDGGRRCRGDAYRGRLRQDRRDRRTGRGRDAAAHGRARYRDRRESAGRQGHHLAPALR